MFTGIITDLGRLEARQEGSGKDLQLAISTNWDTAELDLGASVACNRVCLPVVKPQPGQLAFDVSAETLSKTTIGGWQAGRRINLERSLRLGDDLGGHLVYGHVDGLAAVMGITPEAGSLRFRLRPAADILRLLAPKGSRALAAASLTVDHVQPDSSGVNIIPHSAEVTTFGSYRPGERRNLVVDMLARYVARLCPKP